MMTALLKFAAPIAITAFLWTTGLLTGGEYLHTHIHTHTGQEAYDSCAWHWLLLTAFTAVFVTMPASIAGFVVLFDVRYTVPRTVSRFREPPSRAPPVIL